jgi:cyclohexanecarboxylate-CoA ligase
MSLRWASRHSVEAAARYRADGSWTDLVLADLLRRELAVDDSRVVAVGEHDRVTLAELADRAGRLAGWLAGVGVERGDVVSFILPNWTETIVVDAAICLLGAVSNPIVPIYRDAEVQFILADAQAKVVFVPSVFRNFDYVEMLERLKPSLPNLCHVVTVRSTGSLRYLDILENDPSVVPCAALSADDPRLLLYTSGTTGRAKGVVHSYNTINCELDNVSRTWGIARSEVVLMASPVTHVTGYLYGICLPLLHGTSSLFMQRWDAEQAVGLIEQYGAVGTVAATPFLKELAAVASGAGKELPSFRFFACGGAPVPPEVVRSAMATFKNCAIFRVYGSSEAPTVTLGTMVRGSAVAAETDGYIVGHEVKIVDSEGHALPVGREGEILTYGPEVMLGYLHEQDNEAAFDRDGFFRTGDLGTIRPDGAMIITGRKKDLIIRGGENLSAKEIENVLHEHPDVREVAVVAMPHSRLGEAVCAFVVPKPVNTPRLANLISFLEARGLARQKFPEHLELVETLPRTASGKVQKYILREAIATKLRKGHQEGSKDGGSDSIQPQIN